MSHVPFWCAKLPQVKLPENGTVLIRTNKTLYTLIIAEGLGMMMQGNVKYCPEFTPIDKLHVYPGLPMNYHIGKCEKYPEGHWVVSTRVSEIEVLTEITNINEVLKTTPQVIQHEDHGDI